MLSLTVEASVWVRGQVRCQHDMGPWEEKTSWDPGIRNHSALGPDMENVKKFTPAMILKTYLTQKRVNYIKGTVPQHIVFLKIGHHYPIDI